MAAAEAQSITEMAIKTLEGMRSDEAYDLFFKAVECVRKSTDTEERNLPQKRRAPRHFEIGDSEGYHSITVEQHYCTMYFEALDYAVSGIKERVDQPGYKCTKP